MKVKINKVVPYSSNNKNIKGEPFTIANQQYVFSPHKIQQKNYTGFPIYLQFICTLPDPTLQYEYLKINVTAENADYKQMIAKQSQKFDNIKKAQNKRQFVFTFLPPFKGAYNIKLQYFFRPRYFVNATQQPEQKKDSMTAIIKCEQPFEITQTIINEYKSNNYVFPVLVQHAIQSKYPDNQLQFNIQYRSDKFNFKYLHDKNSFKLKYDQTYYTVIELQPKKIVQFKQQKQFNTGSYYIQYGNNGKSQKRVVLKSNDQVLDFRGETLVKNIPKKDIIDVPIRFSKLTNDNINAENISIVINESLMQGVKIVKISKNKINLDQKASQQLTISIICLKSGFYQLNGISLLSSNNKPINFENDLTLFVQNELVEKAQIFQNTSVINLSLTEELL